jgi:hypothetical protein
MSRAGPPALARLAWLLGELRRYSVLRERKPGVFDLKSRHFLHFHDTPEGLFADVFLAEGRERMPVDSKADQAELLGLVEDALEVVEQRARPDRQRRRGRGRRAEDPGA